MKIGTLEFTNSQYETLVDSVMTKYVESGGKNNLNSLMVIDIAIPYYCAMSNNPTVVGCTKYLTDNISLVADFNISWVESATKRLNHLLKSRCDANHNMIKDTFSILYSCLVPTGQWCRIVGLFLDSNMNQAYENAYISREFIGQHFPFSEETNGEA